MALFDTSATYEDVDAPLASGRSPRERLDQILSAGFFLIVLCSFLVWDEFYPLIAGDTFSKQAVSRINGGRRLLSPKFMQLASGKILRIPARVYFRLKVGNQVERSPWSVSIRINAKRVRLFSISVVLGFISGLILSSVYFWPKNEAYAFAVAFADYGYAGWPYLTLLFISFGAVYLFFDFFF